MGGMRGGMDKTNALSLPASPSANGSGMSTPSSGIAYTPSASPVGVVGPSFVPSSTSAALNSSPSPSPSPSSSPTLTSPHGNDMGMGHGWERGGKYKEYVLSSPLHSSSSSSSLISSWIQYHFGSSDRVERHYSFLISLIIFASVLFICMKSEGPFWTWGSPICNIWSSMLILVTLTNLWSRRVEKWGLFELTRGVQFVLLMLSVLIYYDGSNVVNRYRYAQIGDAMLYDEVLLKMDESLLGWLYPRGQLALYLDTQPTFGVTSVFGEVYAEVFQILYVSYYFWGNAIGVYLAFQYFYFHVYRKDASQTKKRLAWRRVQMFVTAWVGGFVMNHLINLIFPAVSPRIYIKDLYVNELKGLWVLKGLRSAVTNAAANTFSAFPSGHCGLSILAVLLSVRLNLSKLYTAVVALTTVLIVLATQVLRYHYFVDFLFSFIVVAFGAWLGGFVTAQQFKSSLGTGVEAEDEDRGKYEALPLMDGSTPSSSMSPPTAAHDEIEMEKLQMRVEDKV